MPTYKKITAAIIIGIFLKYFTAPYKKNGNKIRLKTACGVKMQGNTGWKKALKKALATITTMAESGSPAVQYSSLYPPSGNKKQCFAGLSRLTQW